MSEPSRDDFLFNESAGDGTGRVTLSEAAEATEHVLESCREELRFLRRYLKGREEKGRDGDLNHGQSGEEAPKEGFKEDVPPPREQALRLASRLEACAGALRNASTQKG